MDPEKLKPGDLVVSLCLLICSILTGLFLLIAINYHYSTINDLSTNLIVLDILRMYLFRV